MVMRLSRRDALEFLLMQTFLTARKIACSAARQLRRCGNGVGRGNARGEGRRDQEGREDTDMGAAEDPGEADPAGGVGRGVSRCVPSTTTASRGSMVWRRRLLQKEIARLVEPEIDKANPEAYGSDSLEQAEEAAVWLRPASIQPERGNR